MDHIIKIEPSDDIAAIRGRVNRAFTPEVVTPETREQERKKSRLLLIVPGKNKTLRNLVNMKLLARLAKAKAIELAVVSSQPRVRDYAREVGLKAYATMRGAKWAGWVPRETTVKPKEETDAPQIAPDEKAKKAADKRIKPKQYRVVSGLGRVGCLQQLGALVAVVALAFGLVFGVFVLLPGATVTITPVAKSVETSLIVTADPEISAVDFANKTFPARLDQVELELSGSIETIDTELAPVGKATGPVVFINRTEDEQIIPISTTVSTSAGEPIQFITVETATIPGGVGATTSTLAIAVEPGPGGNIQAGQINRFEDSLYGISVRVINEATFGGGTMDAAKIVIDSDKERLQEHLRELIRDEGLSQLEASLGELEFVPPESLQVIVLDVTYEEFSGDFSETFSGEMQAVVRGVVVGGYNANRLALAGLQAQVPDGYELDVEGLHFGSGEILAIENRTISFEIFANGKVVPVINPNLVAEEIAFLPVGEAQSRLAEVYELATVPGIELSPEWAIEYFGRLPFIPVRINVVINDAVTLVADGN